MTSYQILYADPPWDYYGDPNKNAAAGKHYKLMTKEAIGNISVPHDKKCVLFLWATCPKLNDALWVLDKWGFHYRGIAWVWVKTSKAGKIIYGQGVRPTFTKPTTELVLVGSTNKKGRTFSIKDEAMGQVILAPREQHSKKPSVVRDNIVKILGDLPRLEMFARQYTPGWDCFGDQL